MSYFTREELLDEFSDVLVDGEPQVSAGERHDIDKYVNLLEHLGYDADYENLVDEYGFIAQVRVNGRDHAIWEGGFRSIHHHVFIIQHPLDSIQE